MSKKSTKMTKIPFRKAKKKVINKKKSMQEKGKKGEKTFKKN